MNKKRFISSSLLALLLVGFVALYVNCSYVPEFNGIDISHHNRIDWKKIKADEDIKFCYIKATEGKSFRDPMCRKHAKRAHENGLLVGLYHYFRTDVSAQQQFENFKRVYDSVPSELIPVIDVEENGNNFRNTSNLNDKLEQLIALFEREYGPKKHYLPRFLLLLEGHPRGLRLSHLVALPKGLPHHPEHHHQASRNY